VPVEVTLPCRLLLDALREGAADVENPVIIVAVGTLMGRVVREVVAVRIVVKTVRVSTVWPVPWGPVVIVTVRWSARRLIIVIVRTVGRESV
jgi:hypothetical protein